MWVEGAAPEWVVEERFSTLIKTYPGNITKRPWRPRKKRRELNKGVLWGHARKNRQEKGRSGSPSERVNTGELSDQNRGRITRGFSVTLERPRVV